MSLTAAHTSRLERHLCERCRERRSTGQYGGAVRADRHRPPSLQELPRATTVCFECYRSDRERQRARQIADEAAAVESMASLRPLAPRLELDERQVAHRRAMLAHMEQQRRATR